MSYTFFFFNDTATTEIYTLSLHDALPIYHLAHRAEAERGHELADFLGDETEEVDDVLGLAHKALAELGILRDRKSTRLNSSHDQISYAVFCLKKKKKRSKDPRRRHWKGIT